MSFLPIDRVMLQTLRTSKIRGVHLAIVVDNKDGENNPGYRVKLKLPWLNEQETTFWARIAIPMGGPGRGTYVLPEIGDQVLVVFEHGDINRPIVIGTLWSKKQEPVEVNQSGKNNTKLIKSRCGHRIIFDDKEDAEKITIVDKTKKNKIVLDSVNKIVKIESDGDIEVIAKTNVIMHSNALKIGTSEGVTGKGASLLTHSAKTFGLKATNRITIGGGNTTINVSNAAATNVSGSGAGELGEAGAEAPKEQIQEQTRGDEASGGGGGGGSAGAGAAGAGAGGTAGGTSSNGTGGGGAPGNVGGTDTDEAGADPPPADPTAVDPDQIEIAVVSKPGAPQPDVLFELTFPDGDQKAGTTNAGGMIRFSMLRTSGNARLVFPELDEHVVDDEPAQPGRVRYQQGGVDAPIGAATTVEVVPRIRRGRLFGMLFEIDKSFLLPGAMAGIRGLTRYYNEHPGLHVLVSGHTDPTGADQYNLDLSNERAQSVADFLSDQVDGWLKWYSAAIASKRWGVREDQFMLSMLRDPAQPFYAGPIDGVNGSATQDAVRQFQTFSNASRGSTLVVDGQLGPNTRRELVTMYMQQDETTLPAGTPLEIHGCGEFHPALPGDDLAANAEDRRVEIFLFEGPVDPPAQQPCPAPGCREYPIWRDRVFEDVDFRTAPPPADPVPSNPRFEAEPPPDTEELAIALLSLRRQPCSDCMATVLIDDIRRFARSDGSGVLHLDVPKGTAKVVVRYVPPELVTPIEITIELALPPVSDDTGAIKRLVHLGYPAATDLQFAVFRFQSDFGVSQRTGQLDAATRQRLADVYDEGKHA